MDWGFIATVIVTVALGATTIVLAFKLAKKKQPVWAYRTTKVIGLGSNAPPELKLTFNQQRVNDVYQTRLILFNKGNETILPENITESLAVRFEGADILREPTVLAKSRDGIRARARQIVQGPNGEIEIGFDYLDHNDGAVIEVLHTASENIEMSGNIIGTTGIRYMGEFAPIPVQPVRGIIVPSLVALAGLALGLIAPSAWTVPREYLAICIAIALLVVPVAIWLGLVPFFRARRFPRWSVVKS